MREKNDPNFFANDPDHGDYKWIVLQEQSVIPSIPQYRASSTYSAKLLDQYAQKGNDTQTMFFMTWGRRNGFEGYGVHYPSFVEQSDEVVKTYLHYVVATSTVDRPTYLAPVGIAFRTIWDDCLRAGRQTDSNYDPGTDPNCLFHKLYERDGYHPSPLGTYVASLTIATAMTGFDPEKVTKIVIPRRRRNQPESDDDFATPDHEMIRDAVSRTILQTYRSGLISYPWKGEPWITTTTTSTTGGPKEEL